MDKPGIYQPEVREYTGLVEGSTTTTTNPMYPTGLFELARKINGKFEPKSVAPELALQHFPGDVSIKRSADYEELYPIGMNDAKQQYKGGKTTLTFSAYYVRSKMDGRDVVAYVTQACKLTRNQSATDPPKRIFLDLGVITNTLPPTALWLLKDVTADYSVFFPRLGYAPQFAKLDFTFELAPSNNLPRSSNTY